MRTHSALAISVGNRARTGFTLVEMLIAMTVLLVVLGSAGAVQISITGLLSSISTRGHVDEDAQRALNVLGDEMRWAQRTTLLVTQQNGSSRIDFKVPVGYAGGNPVWSTTITYFVETGTTDWNGDGTLNDGRLVRLTNGQRKVLCNTIPPAGFTATQTGTNIVLALQITHTDPHTRQLLVTNANTSISIRN